MCDGLKRIKKRKVRAYKIVAVKNGRYYSPAMGCLYPMEGDIPIIEEQDKIVLSFKDGILESQCFKKELVGRTSGFASRIDAERVGALWIHSTLLGYTLQVKEIILTKGLMSGVYKYHAFHFLTVYAGKHIEFLD